MKGRPYINCFINNALACNNEKKFIGICKNILLIFAAFEK